LDLDLARKARTRHAALSLASKPGSDGGRDAVGVHELAVITA
jgi:hypothetical protein